MEVKLAESAGFCFGVKRAIDIVLKEAETGEPPIYTYGPIIHNEEVVRDLEERGVRAVDEEQMGSVSKGTMIIRSHGISRVEQEKLEAQGLKLVDATCPFVKKIHKIADKATAEGRTLIIIGNPDHPEVQGIVGWANTDVYVVQSREDAEKLPRLDRVTVVSQTTFNYNKFKELVEIIEAMVYNTIVVNTICNATQERQTEAREIAGQVDAMIVIGGKHSSNTQKLYDICRSVCPNSYYIQTLVDLDKQGFAPVRSVGITAGASTPNNIIEEVCTHVRSKL